MHMLVIEMRYEDFLGSVTSLRILVVSSCRFMWLLLKMADYFDM